MKIVYSKKENIKRNYIQENIYRKICTGFQCSREIFCVENLSEMEKVWSWTSTVKISTCAVLKYEPLGQTLWANKTFAVLALLMDLIGHFMTSFCKTLTIWITIGHSWSCFPMKRKLSLHALKSQTGQSIKLAVIYAPPCSILQQRCWSTKRWNITLRLNW